ncbi:MAG: YggS family pyridoxal phosphate-dependent enzyme [Capsulimonadales bacterium]|nr:YggS family pyridoxal phosphate-dependent enzyme [Capsulimonadales bacterium]
MISDRLQRVRERIHAAAERVGRSAGDITTVAVTKTVPPARIREAIAAGARHFGENYVQEARVKIAEISSFSEEADISIQWHLIGHLQSNKVKYATELFSLIHSVDNYQLLQEIERQASKRERIQEILIEVDLTDIERRTGISAEALPALVDAAGQLPHVALHGLMGIAPVSENETEARAYFARIRALWERLPAENRRILSMGMSGDFEAAIAEGATHVRIGSAIFGERPVKR